MLMVQTSLCDELACRSPVLLRTPRGMFEPYKLYSQARIQSLQDDASAKKAETASIKRQITTKEAKISDALVVRVPHQLDFAKQK